MQKRRDMTMITIMVMNTSIRTPTDTRRVLRRTDLPIKRSEQTQLYMSLTDGAVEWLAGRNCDGLLTLV